MKKFHILIACEFSGIVRDAFIRHGHNAVSCDLLPCESDKGVHYQGDVFDIINEEWDMMIAFPPCTYLCVSGNRWMKNNPERLKKREAAIKFFKLLYNANVKKIAIENPVGVMSTQFRKPNQYIQPWQFGHPETKKTGLWLKGLPLLKPSEIVTPEYIIGKDGNKYSPVHYCSQRNGKEERWKLRSRTHKGIAESMATQWGKHDS